MTIETDRYPVDERGYTDSEGIAAYKKQSVSKVNKDRHYGVGTRFVRFGKSVRYSYAAADAEAAENQHSSTREAEAA